jgi:hypothetical protein
MHTRAVSGAAHTSDGPACNSQRTPRHATPASGHPHVSCGQACFELCHARQCTLFFVAPLCHARQCTLFFVAFGLRGGGDQRTAFVVARKAQAWASGGRSEGVFAGDSVRIQLQ